MAGWWFGTWMDFMTFPWYWEWNNHPNWRTPWFFRGVGWNHQPDDFSAGASSVTIPGYRGSAGSLGNWSRRTTAMRRYGAWIFKAGSSCFIYPPVDSEFDPEIFSNSSKSRVWPWKFWPFLVQTHFPTPNSSQGRCEFWKIIKKLKRINALSIPIIVYLMLFGIIILST